MALVFAVMHFCTILKVFIASVHSFVIVVLLKKSVVDELTGWSTIPACPSLMCFFFNRVNTEGTNSLKILCLMFVCFL